MLPRKLEDLDDDSPTQLIRTRVMRREEVAASSVVPVARPTRPSVPSVRLRKRLASTPAAPAAAPADEAPTEIHARVVPPAPETAPLPPTLPAVPSARATAYDAPPTSAPPSASPPSASAPPSGHPASDTFAPTSFAPPTAPPSQAPPASDTFAATSFATPASLRARTPTPAVRVTYRPLALDLDPSLANDPGATQPSRRRRIEAASRRNWAAIAIAGGFLAGLLGSAVALTTNVGAAPSVARASRIHVPSTLPLEIASGSHVKAVEVEEGAAPASPRAPSAAHAAAHAAPARTAKAPAPATTPAAPAEAKPADPPTEEKAAEAPADAKSPAVDLAGKDLLSDGL